MYQEIQYTERLLPPQVVEAFLAEGITPRRGIFSRGGQACGLGSVIRHRSPADDELTDEDIEAKAEEIWGRTYTLAFIAGFDGPGLDRDHFEKTSNPRRGQGYEDGKAAAKVCFGDDE